MTSDSRTAVAPPGDPVFPLWMMLISVNIEKKGPISKLIARVLPVHWGRCPAKGVGNPFPREGLRFKLVAHSRCLNFWTSTGEKWKQAVSISYLNTAVVSCCFPSPCRSNEICDVFLRTKILRQLRLNGGTGTC